MRRVFLTWMLIVLSFSVGAANANIPEQSVTEPIINIPFIQTDSPKLHQEDLEFCGRRARVGAAAHLYALQGGSIEKQLKTWDEFSLSLDSQHIPVDELLTLRKIIAFAWDVVKQHPELTSNQYGDFIFNTCVQEKSLIMVEF